MALFGILRAWPGSHMGLMHMGVATPCGTHGDELIWVTYGTRAHGSQPRLGPYLPTFASRLKFVDYPFNYFNILCAFQLLIYYAK